MHFWGMGEGSWFFQRLILSPNLLKSKIQKFFDKQCAIPSCSEEIQMVPRTLCARGTIKNARFEQKLQIYAQSCNIK